VDPSPRRAGRDRPGTPLRPRSAPRFKGSSQHRTPRRRRRHQIGGQQGGDSYDNAAAESLIGLYKTELICRRGPCRGLDDVELATLEYVDWFNHRRLHSHCGNIPPAEFENNYYRSIAGLTEDQPAEPSLR
jgi:transposase InsO family protein